MQMCFLFDIHIIIQRHNNKLTLETEGTTSIPRQSLDKCNTLCLVLGIFVWERKGSRTIKGQSSV